MSAPCLELRHVSMRFDDKSDGPAALEDVNLGVDDGEFVTIVGPSGCGKSTLLYLIGGFLKATAGTLLLHGQPIKGPGPDRGVVFQRYSLFPWLTVEDNIAYGLKEQGIAKEQRDRVVAEHLRMVHLEGMNERYPRQLSGGMQQRVALAQTLACNPEILLMDEPFGALDAQTRRLLQDEMRRIWHRTGKTVLFVTHDVEEAVALGTSIIVMAARPGHIKEVVRREFSIADGEEFDAHTGFVDLKLRIWRSVKEEVERMR